MKITVIGAGPGGYIAAIRAAQKGAEVTLIEKENFGGTCLNWGCIPSKIFKQSADTINTINHSDTFCVSSTTEPSINFNSLQKRVRETISSQTKGIKSLLEKHNIQILQGAGKLLNKNEVEVTLKDSSKEKNYFDKLILATGSKPAELPFLPFDGKRVLSSNDIFRMEELPKSITIIGGGVIGCEFASIFNSFGCKVTLVEGLDRLLPIPSIDEECSKLLLREMKKKKITVKTNSTLLGANVTNTGITVEIGATVPEKRKKIDTIESDIVLVCIGRKSTSSNLELQNADIEETDRNWIITNDHFQTTAENIFAIGDALGPEKVMLAHTASSEAEIAVANCFGENKTLDYTAMPSAIFTMPEIGCVGLSETEAVEKYGVDKVASASTLFRSLGKAHVIGEIAGQTKLVFEKNSGKILGVHIAGPHATDLLGEATLAVKIGVTVDQLAETIHAHPTLAEIMLETAFKAQGEPLHG